MADLKAFAEQLVNLTVKEVNELAQILKDEYGIPYDQLKFVLTKKFNGVVFVTAISSVMGQLPYQLLADLGYPLHLIRRAPLLFSTDLLDKLKKILYLYGVKLITGYFMPRKNYFYFSLNPKNDEHL